jgi:hypothetical protein
VPVDKFHLVVNAHFIEPHGRATRFAISTARFRRTLASVSRRAT